jgi:hypothetical protein
MKRCNTSACIKICNLHFLVWNFYHLPTSFQDDTQHTQFVAGRINIPQVVVDVCRAVSYERGWFNLSGKFRHGTGHGIEVDCIVEFRLRTVRIRCRIGLSVKSKLAQVVACKRQCGFQQFF